MNEKNEWITFRVSEAVKVALIKSYNRRYKELENKSVDKYTFSDHLRYIVMTSIEEQKVLK